MINLELTDGEVRTITAYIKKADYWEMIGILQKEYGENVIEGTTNLSSIYFKLTGKHI